jgi:hypothetical protein
VFEVVITLLVQIVQELQMDQLITIIAVHVMQIQKTIVIWIVMKNGLVMPN